MSAMLNLTFEQHNLFGPHIIVACPYSYLNEIKALPGARWNHVAEKRWSYPATAAHLVALLALFAGQPLTIDARLGDLLLDDGFPEEELAPLPTTPIIDETQDLAPIPLIKTAPWRHQIAAYHHSMARVAAMLAMSMGTGKSRVVCDVVANRGCRRVLILCPKSVVAAWPGQFAQHCAVGCRVVALHSGSVQERARIVSQMLTMADKPLVVVLNYDAARSEPLRGVMVAQAWDLVVCDESHKISDPTTQISLLCQELREHSRFRLALTGTPFKQTPLDIFGQFLFLDASILGTSHYRFQQRYAKWREFDTFKKLVGVQHEEELMQRFHMLAYRVTADVLDLPEVQHIERLCSLAPKTRKIYDEVNHALFAQIEEGKLTVASGGVKMLRLQQMTGGDFVADDGTHLAIDTAKADALKELLDELDAAEPVVVFARFKYDLRAIEQVTTAMHRRYAELSGDRNDLAKWQQGGAEVLGVQIQSGSAGIDLTRACYGVYYSIGHSLTDYDQSLARLHRPGQQRSVTYLHLIAQSSVDEDVYAALRDHKSIIEHLFNLRKTTLISA